MKSLSLLFDDVHLERILTLTDSNFSCLGNKYQLFIDKVVEMLKERYQPASQYTDVDLAKLVGVADVVGHDSIAMMKRLKEACIGCGWCCAKTNKIIIEEPDVIRISRKLKKPVESFFMKIGEEWAIKQAHPCQ